MAEEESRQEIDRAICRLGLAMICADGEVVEEEREAFYAQMSSLDVSVETFGEVIEENIEDILEKMPVTIEFIAGTLDFDDRGTVLDTLEDLADADGEMDSKERQFLKVLAEAWGY